MILAATGWTRLPKHSTPKTLDHAPQISEASLKPTAILRVTHVMIVMMIAALLT
jgi:hypothetical protein